MISSAPDTHGIKRAEQPLILNKELKPENEVNQTLSPAVRKIVEKLELDDAFYEGHTSHTLDNINTVILLRCDPSILGKRLSERNYSEDKIRENLEAEALNIILDEALDHISSDKIFQLDTTNLSPDESAKKLTEFINGSIKLDETFDYSERIMDWY